MASKEAGFFRETEPVIEKGAGFILGALGLITWEFPAIAGGVLLTLFGMTRTPKQAKNLN